MFGTPALTLTIVGPAAERARTRAAVQHANAPADPAKTTATDNPIRTACLNDFTTTMNGRIDWTDNCNERVTRLLPAFIRPANNNSAIENFSQTDAFAEEGVFTVTHTQSRTVRNFAAQCDASRFIARVILPEGVQMEESATFLHKNETTLLPLLDLTLNGNEALLTFDGSSVVLNGDYRLDLGFTADCSVTAGPTDFPFEFTHVCVDCDCVHLWYCGDLPGPQLHKRTPSCPEEQVQVCPEGIQTTDFRVDRTSFGFTDINYSTEVEPSNVNTKVAVACDLVEMRVSNIVGMNDISDNIGIDISYQNPDGTDSDDEIFLYQSGAVTFFSGGQELSCALTPADITTISDAGGNRMSIDLSQCLTGLGLTLSQGDSINFLGVFALNPEGPYTTQFNLLPAFRAEGFAIVNGTREACDNFGENFTIAKVQTAFDFPNSDDYPTGCETAALQYRLITINNGFAEFFPNEFRPAIGVDSFVLDFDPAILEDFADATVEVSIPGHPTFGSNFFPLLPLTAFPNGHYTAFFDTLDYQPPLNIVQNFSFSLRLNLQATCASSLTEAYNLSPTIYYQDRVYAAGSDTDCQSQEETAISSNLTYSEAPEISLTPDSPTNHILTGDTAVWTVQICNLSQESSAGFTWLAAEDFSGILDFVSAEDVTNPDAPFALDLSTYGENANLVFTATGLLEQADGLNAFDEICRKVRLKATLNACQNANFEVKAGYNCAPYEADWTPADNTSCTEEILDLSLTLRTPFLEAEVINQDTSQPDICTEESVTLLLRNNDMGAAFDVRTNLILPSMGATLVPGSVEISYPNGADFVPATADPVFIEQTLAGTLYRYEDFSGLSSILDSEGLSGFDPNNPSTANEVAIRFRFTTDCDFRSGGLLFYNFQGLQGCGAATNFEAGETLPIIINDTQTAENQLFDIAFSGMSSIIPGGTASIEVNLTNLSNSLTGADDFISVSLPPGISYLPGTTESITPTDWVLEGPEITIGADAQILLWQNAPGLAQGESASFRFSVEATNFGCEVSEAEVRLVTLSQTELFCTETQENCDVQSITSTNGGILQTLPVNGALSIEIESAQSNCAADNQEEVFYGGQIITSSAVFPDQEYTLDIYHDENQNGSIDESEPLLHQVTVTGQITTENALPFAFDFLADIDKVCQLILRLGAENSTFCGNTDFVLPPPQLLNSGEDTILCASESTEFTVELGVECASTGAYNYTWTAIPPASVSDLDLSDFARPVATIPNNATPNQTTFSYVLATQRVNCEVTFDTINIIRGATPSLSLPAPVVISPGSSGLLEVIVSGGSEPYAYEWSPAENLNGANLPVPTVTPTETEDYTLNLTDNQGCTASITFPVTVADPLEAGLSPGDTTICTNETLTISGSGGDNYLWVAAPSNNGGILSSFTDPQTTFSGGLAGEEYTYSLIVSNNEFPDFTDTVSISISVIQSPEIAAGQDVTICAGESVTIGADITAAAGAEVFWSPEVLFGQNSNEAVVNPLSTTVYTLNVVQENGCSETQTFTVTVEDCDCQPAMVSAVSVQNTTCGVNSGSIVITTEESSDNYNFIFSPEAGTGSGNTRTDLPFGGYTVSIANASNPDCTTEVFVIVENEDGPQAFASTEAATCSLEDGTALLQPENFTYTWPDGVETNERANLASGTYFVTFTDPAEDTCPNVLAVLVEEDNPLEVSHIVNNLPDCGESNGSVTLEILGGSGDYTFSWLSETATQENLSAGVYNISLTDNVSGCVAFYVFALENAGADTEIAVDEPPILACFGDTDGLITFNIEVPTGSPLPTDTIISDGFQTYTNGNLPAGNYCILTETETGCVTGSDCFTITAPPPITVNLSTDPACEDGGSIVTEISGGTPPYTVLWNDLNTDINRSDLVPGQYSLTVTDQNACSGVATTVVNTCDCETPLIESVVSMLSLCDEPTGAATVNMVESNENFTYTWIPDSGIPNATGNVRTNLAAGNYLITISRTDNPSCQTQTEVVVNNEDGPAVNIEVSPAFCNEANGTATLSPAEFSYIWELDGSTASMRSDLPAGTYVVEVTEPANPECPNLFQVTIPEANPLTAEVVIDQAPTCQAANGTVSLVVEGGSGNYAYSWPSNAATQDNLAGGLYTVTVTDLASSGCALPVLFVLTDDVPQAEVLVLETNDVTCAGAQDGQLVYDLDLQDGFAEPLDTIISNGIAEFENGNLPAGNFCLVINDANGCVAGGFCFEINEPEPLQIIAEATESCGNDGTISASVIGGVAPYSYFWNDNASEDPFRDNLPPGFYILTVRDANDCEISSNIQVPECVNCEVYQDLDTFLVQVPCDSSYRFCLDLTPALAPFYEITDNGMLRTDLEACGDNDEFLSLDLEVGNHLLVAENTLTGCVDTLTADIVCAQTDSLNIDIFLYEDSLVCFSTEELFTEFDTLINICPDGEFISYTLQNDTCLLLETIGIGNEEACIVLCDTLGICDTTYLNINVLDNNPTAINDTIIVSQTGSYCFDDLDFSLEGEFFSISNLCPEESGSEVNFLLNDTTFCVEYEGLAIGQDSACIEVCDDLNNCDTLGISLVVVPGEFVFDTLFISAEPDTVCLSTEDLDGTVESFYDACPELNNENVEFTLNEEDEEFCVVYAPLSVGIDTACIWLIDEFGNVTLTNFIITVIETSPQFITDTIFIAQSDTVCLDTSELPAGIDFVDDACAEFSTGNVDFFLNPLTNCIEYTGLELGKDTACYYICDSLGICDTTFFCIFVEEFFDPPTAEPDTASTLRGTPVVIDIKANDIIFGGITSSTIITPPQYGTAIINPDCSVTYLPDPLFCERTDVFMYQICNENGCDFATVEVFIECIDVRVFNVISPNGDGKNDFFHIANIENRQGRLEVFNRWGTMVYKSVEYQNNWPGSFNDKDLPDGVYYYLLEWTDPDSGEEFFQRGYVELRR